MALNVGRQDTVLFAVGARLQGVALFSIDDLMNVNLGIDFMTPPLPTLAIAVDVRTTRLVTALLARGSDPRRKPGTREAWTSPKCAVLDV